MRAIPFPEEDRSALPRIPAQGAFRLPNPVSCPDANEVLAFLEGHLAQEDATRLEAHVDTCDECRRLVAMAAAGASQSGSRSPREDVPPSVQPCEGTPLLQTGAHLDAYVIVRSIGRGGMGEVYLAKDQELGRRVAIKVIRSDRVGSPGAVERFVAEARTTARFNHPNIVTLYGVGRVRGAPYLALEYVDGDTLRRSLDRGPLAIGALIAIARSIADATRTAHRHGVIHGDLKPSNVLVARDGRIRVLDFGLARLVRPEPDASIDSTLVAGDGRSAAGEASQEALQGTPAYMAPELWQGTPATALSDVWALGVMMVEMATGHAPFAIGQLARGEVDTSDAMARLAACGASEPLCSLIAGCLRRDPSSRSSMHAALDALARLDAPPVGLGGPADSSRDPSPMPHPSAKSVASDDAVVRHARQEPASKGARWAGWGVGALLLLGAGLVAARGIATSPPTATRDAKGSRMLATTPIRGHSNATLVVASVSPPSAPALAGTRSLPAASAGPAAKPPLPSMRLAALASLEDRAEEADQRARAETDPARIKLHRDLARQYRAAADQQLRGVEVQATNMQQVEPGDAAILLDYVKQGRAYLARRRAVSGARP